MAATDRDASPRPGLGAWDASSLVVGIVIGTTIFKAPGYIASQTSSVVQLMGLWAVGGVFAFFGALCYAELAAAYGGAGGDYDYLTRAFGRWAGFLFGWTQLIVTQTVNIGALSAVFAEFALKSYLGGSRDPAPGEIVLFAAIAVSALTCINLAGLTMGKLTQNLLTAAKLGGVGMIILTAMFTGSGDRTITLAVKTSGDWTTALILILYAFGGWNDAAFVVTEVRDSQRNVPRALLGGVCLITAVYLAVNLSYLSVLGFAGLQHSSRPPEDLMQAWWGEIGGRVINAVVMVSALGAVNGLILSVSRVHAAVGADHRLFSWMGRWSSRHQAPVGSLIVQALFTIALLGLIGTRFGRDFLDRVFLQFFASTLPWERFGGAFDLLVSVGAPVFWLFFLATGLACIVLRVRDPDRPRPFRIPLFPLAPILFCGMCVFGIYASVRWAGALTLLGVLAVALGAVVYAAELMLKSRPGEEVR